MAIERWFRFIIIIPEWTKVWSQLPPGGRQQTRSKERRRPTERTRDLSKNISQLVA
jgi:hypothetical protein